MKSLHAHAALLTLAIAAALAACTREDAGARVAAVTANKAPAGNASLAPANVAAANAEGSDPLGAKVEISRMMDSFVAVESYHVDMNTSSPKGDMAMEMDFVAPDRYRMKMPTGTQYVIGDTMYMAMNGRTMKVALPKGQLANYRDPARIAAHKATMTVESLGRDTIDGQAAQKFVVRNTEPRQVESTIWVGADGYPLRIEVDGKDGGQVARTTIRYSRFNDPSIRIDPPR